MVKKDLNRPKVRSERRQFSQSRKQFQLLWLGLSALLVFACFVYFLFPKSHQTYLATISINDYGEDSIVYRATDSMWNSEVTEESLKLGNWSPWILINNWRQGDAADQSVQNRVTSIPTKQSFLNLWDSEFGTVKGTNWLSRSDTLIVQLRCQAIVEKVVEKVEKVVEKVEKKD
jgi:hypothetical protein